LSVKKVVKILAVALVLLALDAGWQMGSSMLRATELQDDMKDIASQFSTRIGYSNAASDDELRDSVVRKARTYGFNLKPGQVTVRRSGEGRDAQIYLAAHFENPIELPGFSFGLHFNLEGGQRP
jgi:hypothetical protein